MFLIAIDAPDNTVSASSLNRSIGPSIFPARVENAAPSA